MNSALGDCLDLFILTPTHTPSVGQNYRGIGGKGGSSTWREGLENKREKLRRERDDRDSLL